MSDSIASSSEEESPITTEARASQRGDRKINQDRCEIFTHKNIKVLVLADGMGGHPKGEVAAQILVDTTYHLLNNVSEDNFDINTFINNVFNTAHRQIINYGLKKKPQIHPRTTAVIVVIQDDQMVWSHLGDSRTYLFRHGRAHMRTLDHTRVEHLRLSGQIEDSDSQSLASGRSGVSRCLGGLKKMHSIEITPPIQLQDGDLIMMCSDGVWSQLQATELEASMITKSIPLTDRINNLINKAVEAGSPNSDNATALALCWHSKEQRQKPRTSHNKDASLKADADSNKENQADNDVDSAIDLLRGLIDKYQ